MIEERELRLENRHTGEVLYLSRTHLESGEEAIRLRGSLPPGSDGPPPHIHTRESERGTVLSGRLGAVVDGEEIVLEAGEEFVFPAGQMHTWWNAGNELLETEGIAYPAADLDRYLQAMFAVLNAGKAGRPSPVFAAHIARRHRTTQYAAIMPRPLQRLLFPVLVAFGRLTGKYSGDDWPGSPSSSKEAPHVEGGTVQRGVPDPEKMRELGEKYGQEVVGPPLAVSLGLVR
jgi:mannose-6-phosphate isomerase-like protein (cupin superfamily)